MDYEDGKCKPGYEFVHSYTDFRGIWHDSYCRKLPKRIPRKEKRYEKKEEEQFKEINNDF